MLTMTINTPDAGAYVPRDHGCFAVVCDGTRITRVLEITGLRQILDVFGSREAALAYVRQSEG